MENHSESMAMATKLTILCSIELKSTCWLVWRLELCDVSTIHVDIPRNINFAVDNSIIVFELFARFVCCARDFNLSVGTSIMKIGVAFNFSRTRNMSWGASHAVTYINNSREVDKSIRLFHSTQFLSWMVIYECYISPMQPMDFNQNRIGCVSQQSFL